MANNGPDPKGQPLTLTALERGHRSARHRQGSLYFYRDNLGNGVFNASKDQLLGAGKTTDGSDYSLAISTSALPVGLDTFFARTLDSYGRYSGAISGTATISDNTPRISNLLVVPAAPAAGLPVTLRAVGVSVLYNTVSSVSFYWDPTGAGTLTNAVLLGAATAKQGFGLTTTLPGADATPNPFPTTGTAKFLAQAMDASGTLSLVTVVTASVNTPPTIDALTSNPVESVERTQSLTLTATDVVEPNDTITRVAFYRGLMGDTSLNTKTATLLGYGVKSGTGPVNYVLTTKVSATLVVGTYPLFAVATNSHGAVSNVVTTSVAITYAPPVIAGLTVTAPALVAGHVVTLRAAGVTDPDGVAQSVSFYWDPTGSGTLTNAVLLGTATAKQGWAITVTLSTLTDPSNPFPNTGTATFLAQAVDNDGALSVAKTLTVNVDAAPTIGALSPSLATVNPGQHLTLTASGVADANDTISAWWCFHRSPAGAEHLCQYGCAAGLWRADGAGHGGLCLDVPDYHELAAGGIHLLCRRDQPPHDSRFARVDPCGYRRW